ncbi:hypothetical protein [Gordonia sihwensis]|uniref:hypothetical protein n=1 Tax=Gordonia sihwensis TaxID=173559 RepID=UPI003D96C6DA
MAKGVVIHVPVVQTYVHQIEDSSADASELSSMLLHRGITRNLGAIAGSVEDPDALLKQALDFAMRIMDEEEGDLGKRAHSLSSRFGEIASELTSYIAEAKRLDADGTDALVDLTAQQAAALPPTKIGPTFTDWVFGF